MKESRRECWDYEMIRCHLVDLISWIQLTRHTSTGRCISGTDLVRCVTSLDTVLSLGCLSQVLGRPRIRTTCPRLKFLEPQGAVPPGSKHLQGSSLNRLATEAPQFRGIPAGSEAFWGMPGVFEQRPCSWTHLKKGLVLLLSVRKCVQRILLPFANPTES